jgi:chemotaxis protein MotB
MPRRNRHLDEHENHERWLVSYADFITLLFAFFVVMYAISSVNEGKYRVLSNSLVSAFKEVPRSPEIVNLGKEALSKQAGTQVIRSLQERSEADRKRQRLRRMKELEEKVHMALDALEKLGQVTVTQDDKGIVVEINAGALFGTGDATLSREAVKVLTALGLVLVGTENPVQVQGHTDSVPIRTLQFPSNWELSAARAGSVVRLMAENGVNPARLSAIGYADNRPVAGNESAEGRARNRRIAIFIAGDSGDADAGAAPRSAPARPPAPQQQGVADH